MGTITSSVGLISGINTGQIVDELMQLESQPVVSLQTQLNVTNAQQQAFGDLATQLGTMQTIGQTLENANTFTASTATSSDSSVLTATASNGAAVGTYTLQVAQTVTTQQLISIGFADQNSTPVGAGTISIEMGGGSLVAPTTLASLNGGNGVNSGEFRITDGTGNSAVINTATDINLDDVVKQINNADGIDVTASVSGNHLVLTSNDGTTTTTGPGGGSGPGGTTTSNTITVTDMNDGTAAADLGIAGTSSTGTITGTGILTVTASTSLDALNDGRGVQSAESASDFQVKTASGAIVSVNLATAKTVGDVINAINTAGGANLVAAINNTGTGITLTDKTAGAGTRSITATNGSQAATELGLTLGNQTNATMTGNNIAGGIDTTLLSSLNGGAGITLGKVNFTDRSGHTQTIDLSGASTVQDVIDDINNATPVKLKASLNSSGDGIQITDASGGTGDLVIADNTGTGAQQLGIAGTFTASTTGAVGTDLHKQWVTDSTELSTLNGGKGIGQGSFTITNAKGQLTTFNVGSNVTTVSALLYQINARDAGITASINPKGNGILLTDTSGGTGTMTVADGPGSTTASDLNLTGTATAGQIDGAYEKTITVGANDTLQAVETKINALNWGLSATIINDGSATNPYRLSLTANNSGTAGQVVVDTGTTNLGTYNLVNAQDAAVFVGSADSAKPLLVTSSTNQIQNVISGVTMNLQGVSSSPVTLTVARDPTGVTTQLNNFVNDFNDLVTAISTLTSYNSTTSQAGLLLGDNTTLQIQSQMYNMLDTVVQTGSDSIKSLSDVGITIGSGAALQFDQSTFTQAFESDPDAVQKLFNATESLTNADGSTTTKKTGVAYGIDQSIDALTDPANGIITIENQSLTSQMTDFQTQITDLNQQLSDKRNVLQSQFTNMETVLANLQSQQASLASLTGSTTSSSSSSSSKSS